MILSERGAGHLKNLTEASALSTAILHHKSIEGFGDFHLIVGRATVEWLY